MRSGILLWIGELGNITGKKDRCVGEMASPWYCVCLGSECGGVNVGSEYVGECVGDCVDFFLDAVACLLMTYSSGNDLLRYFSDSLIDTLVGWCI